METFMGHPMSYWSELEKRAQTLDVTNWIEELGRAYAKVGFYEKRLGEMAKFMKANSN